VPLKLDVSVPAARWVRLASDVAGVVAEADPGALVIIYGHVADGNLHVNVVPGAGRADGADRANGEGIAGEVGIAAGDGRHEDAVFSFVASLGGSISAEHGIGALKARWLPLVRSDVERALFARLRAAFDPAGILNPHVLPR
jgi:FAD/FMN-containing dehydrogenase